MGGTSAAITFSTSYERRPLQVLVSLLTFEWGSGWTTGVWRIWATAPDGEQFLVKELSDEGTANYTIEAFRGQLALEEPISWAESKDFTDLAIHLRDLRDRPTLDTAQIEDAKRGFVGREVRGESVRFVGDDIAVDGADLILRFHHVGVEEAFGVRFRNPALPQEGIAYSGIRMRTPRDWIQDLNIVLDEELLTGALLAGPRKPHDGWTELFIAPDRWPSRPPGEPLGDWGDWEEKAP
jgi:hypothetical protein